MNTPNNETFPIPTAVPGNGWMTLRDYFAGQSLIAHRSMDLNAECGKIANWAYEDSDAMLKARKADQ